MTTSIPAQYTRRPANRRALLCLAAFVILMLLTLLADWPRPQQHYQRTHLDPTTTVLTLRENR